MKTDRVIDVNFTIHDLEDMIELAKTVDVNEQEVIYEWEVLDNEYYKYKLRVSVGDDDLNEEE